MDTVPNNGKRTQNRNLTATILPINRGSDGSYTSPPYENSDYPDDHSETPRRLTFTVDEAAFLLNISRGLAYEQTCRENSVPFDWVAGSSSRESCWRS